MADPIRDTLEEDLSGPPSGEQLFWEALQRRTDVAAREQQEYPIADCEASLQTFQEAAWGVVEPRDHVSNWHIAAICEHLEAVTAGAIPNLLINIPPRHEKSLLSAVFWPAWVWTHSPEKRFLFASYKRGLALEHAGKSRRILKDPWYQERWGGRFQLLRDQDTKSHYANDQGGHRISFSVGTGTGEGGDFIVVDDPHDVDESESPREREAAIRWWRETMSTRLDDPATGAKIVVGQRVAERDLSGWILESGDHYEVLSLPAEYGRGPSTVSFAGAEVTDPRSEPDELLWPERFPRKVLDQMKKELGRFGSAAQLNQNPESREGGMFDRADFRRAPAAPANPTGGRVVYIDKAGTSEEDASPVTSYTAIGRISIDQGETYIEDMVRGRWAQAKRDRRIRQYVESCAEKFGPHSFQVVVEQEPGSGGKDSAQATVKDLQGYRVHIDRAGASKSDRADPLAGQAQAGNVYYVAGPWNEDFLDEIDGCNPDEQPIVDQVDVATGGYNWLALEKEEKAPEPVSPTWGS